MNRPLSDIQINALVKLRRHGSWPSWWTLQGTTNTIRILDTLVRRGLVTKTDGPQPTYEINNAGRAVIGADEE